MLLKFISLCALLATTGASFPEVSTENAVYVNALGQEIIPSTFEWGRIATKDKNAAKLRHCGMLDGSGRLGRRQATCPDGYTLSCDGSQAYPCCPTASPLCCPNSDVCCGADQVCQGRSTCCDAGQVGCGEACCNHGETCCGTNCCASGYTCSNGSCLAPRGSSGLVSTASPTSPITSAVNRAATGSTTLIDTIVPSSTTSTSNSTNQSNNNNNNNNNNDNNSNSGDSSSDSINLHHGPSPATLGGAIGGSLGGVTAIAGIIAAWWARKKQQAKKALAALEAAKPKEEVKDGGLKPPGQSEVSVSTGNKEREEPYEVTRNDDTWVERPALISAAMGGHGSGYT